jgi:hypothetical protein
MFVKLKVKVWIWLINHGWMYADPWNDPRRPAHDRARWIEAEPKSLKKEQRGV